MDSGVAAQVADRADPQPPERLAGLLPHAPEPSDRQRLEERLRPVRGHHEHPVGLAVVGGELRHELRRRDARPSTSRRPRARPSARILAAISAGTRTAAWRPRRPGTPRRARSAPRAACRSSRTSRNRLEWARYASKSDGRKMHVGTQAPGADGGHRRTDAEPPGLVGRRRDHAARARPADDDRLARERGILQRPRPRRRTRRCRRAGSARACAVTPRSAVVLELHPRAGARVPERRGRCRRVGPRGHASRASLTPRAMQRGEVPDLLGDRYSRPSRRSAAAAPTPPSRRNGTRSSRPWAGPTRTP